MKTNGITKAVRLALYAGLMTTTLSPAWAEEESDEENENIIVVTARKVEENVQKIPLSVSVISDFDIEDKGMTDINELAQHIVGFSQEKSFGRQADRPVIRGQSTILGREKAAYFIDGVYVAGSIQSYDLESLERVEVIKGPQSAQFGRSTFAGAVNYITKKPDDEFTAKIKLTAAQLGEQRFSAHASGPMGTDWLSYRVGVSTFSFDGDWDNTLANGPEVGGEDSESANLSLYADVNDKTQITLNLNYSDDDDQHYAIALQDSTFNNCFPDSATGYYCGIVSADLDVSIGGSLNDAVPRDEYGIRRERTQANILFEHEFDDGSSISYNFGDSSDKYDAGQDQSFNGTEPFALFGISFHTIESSESDVNSHELRYQAHAMDERLKWSIGYYTFEEETIAGVDSKSSVDNNAFFGMISYDFSDKLTASLELRDAKDDFAGDVIEQYRTEIGELNTEFDSTTYRVALSYFIDDDRMVYLNNASGNSPGQFNISAALDSSVFPLALVPVDEEEKTETELGYKGVHMDGDMTINAAIYYIDWDKQTLTDTFFDANGIPDSFLVNLGQTEIIGFEFMMNYHLDQNWSLGLQYALTDAEITEYYDSNECALRAPTGSDCEDPTILRQFGDVSGNTTPRSPENEVVFSLSFADEFNADWDWFARLDTFYEDSHFAQVHNQAETGDSTKVNLQLGFEEENFRVVFWGDNVTDDDTAQSILRYRDTNSLGTFGQRGFAVSLPKPRQYGVTFSYEF